MSLSACFFYKKRKEAVMNLEHVLARKSIYIHTQIRPQPIQLPLFPKKSVFSSYCLSNANIEQILRKITARGLCGRSLVEEYLRKKLRHNCQPNTIRTIGSTILLFLGFLSADAMSICLRSTGNKPAPSLNMSRIAVWPNIC